MKIVVFFALFTSAAMAAEPDFSKLKVSALPFPEGESTNISVQLPELEARVGGFDGKIGGFPPKFKNDADRKLTYQAWSEAVKDARTLRRRDGDTRVDLCLLAALYRQGNNMDVVGSAENAAVTITKALQKYPSSECLNFQAAYFYLSVGPQHAPKAEEALLRLRQILKTDRDVSVERQLLFAYLSENRLEDVKRQLTHCLELAPSDNDLLMIQKGLKEGTLRQHVQ